MFGKLVTNAKRKLLFAISVAVIQIVFLIIFAVFGEYDEFSTVRGDSTPPDSKDHIQEYYGMFRDVHIMVFAGSGLLLCYMRHYGYSSIGLTFLYCALALQWGTITTGLFGFISIAKERADLPPGDDKPPYKIAVGLSSMLGADFTAASVVVTFGILLGRVSPLQLLIVSLVEGVFYSANEALNIHVLQAQDPGGSLQIHVFGTYFGLFVALTLYKGWSTENPPKYTADPSYMSNMFAMIGTLFLWTLWPSFNAVAVSDDLRNRAIINTYYSLSACVLTSFALSKLLSHQHKFDMAHIQNSTLAGGVAAGSCCHMVLMPYAAILIGCTAATISVVGYLYITPILERKLHIMDSSGVHNLHGLPGLLSGVAAVIAAGVAGHSSADGFINYENSLYSVFPARAPVAVNGNCSLTTVEVDLGIECGSGRSAGVQAGYQVALLVCSVGLSLIGGSIAGILCRWPVLQPPTYSDWYDDEMYWSVPDDSESQLVKKYDVQMKQDAAKEPDVILLKTASLNERFSSMNGAEFDHARAPSVISAHHEFGF